MSIRRTGGPGPPRSASTLATKRSISEAERGSRNRFRKAALSTWIHSGTGRIPQVPGAPDGCVFRQIQIVPQTSRLARRVSDPARACFQKAEASAAAADPALSIFEKRYGDQECRRD